MYQNGISFDKFSDKAEREAKRLRSEFHAILRSEKNVRKNLSKLEILSIDGKNSRALDDALSLERINDDHYRVGIHISDVASLVKKGSEIDKEAFSRVESTYVLSQIKKCHKPMLPHSLNAEIASLIQEQPRLCVTLWLIINKDGLIDLDSANYELSIIENANKLSYEKADRLLKADESQDQSGFSLSNILTSLDDLTSARRSFRKTYESYEHGSSSLDHQDLTDLDAGDFALKTPALIEELMLLAS
jgi:ribonuclease R